MGFATADCESQAMADCVVAALAAVRRRIRHSWRRSR